MLHPRIVEVSTDKATGHVYVLVHFWKTKAARARSDPPYLVEDFLMQLKPQGARLIDAGNPALGSVPFDRDLSAEIKDNIRHYIVRAEERGYEGDNSSGNAKGGAFSIGGAVVREKGTRVYEPRQRDNSDPHGILAKPGVAALRGKNIDLAVTP